MPNSIIEAQITLAEEEAKLAWCSKPWAGLQFPVMRRIIPGVREVKLLHEGPILLPRTNMSWCIPKQLPAPLWKRLWWWFKNWTGYKTKGEKKLIKELSNLKDWDTI